ncbi:HigA family addiction module antitoxin [Thalassospira sp.]|uniref:HigA family addiction module antitoxin n=1 Tax=Thalassospira sp. TaxID=1912094 RepID=UPI002736D8F8|nr:HigA family addiction module antitoxin [Thalassospira sp.]MDP2697476.1 HigA family addiction module antitoxin [Thalassospira sp.]
MTVDRIDRIDPVHPGEVLEAEFLEPLGVSAWRLARDIHVPANRITAIIKGQRAVTADTAVRLAKYFGTSAQFWLNLQTGYDLEMIRDHAAADIDSILPMARAG